MEKSLAPSHVTNIERWNGEMILKTHLIGHQNFLNNIIITKNFILFEDLEGKKKF